MAERPTTAVEPFVLNVTRVVGGPLGRHAGRLRSWFTPATVALFFGTILWMIAVIRQQACRPTQAGLPDAMANQCYSDIIALFTTRGLIEGNTPYIDSGPYQVLEYPVLTGWLMELTRLITVGLGAPVGADLPWLEVAKATNLFLSVNMVVLFIFWLITIAAQLGATPGRGWDTMMIAASPSIAMAALINWDLMPVALTGLGIYFWSRRKPGWAGVMLGLSMAAKLYAGFLLGPLLLLCLRTGRMKEFGRTIAAFAIAWLVPNLPVMLTSWTRWLEFWTFNSDRGGDFGSIWYVFVLAGNPVPDLNTVFITLFVVFCLGIGALIMLAPQRPRIGQVFFLVVLAFMLTNKVYSPQYVIWMLPLLALARPKWRDWVIFTIGEWLYFMAIWGHLGQYLQPAVGGEERVFWAATILRLLTQLWVGVMVVRAILRPEHDIVRARRDIDAARPPGDTAYGAGRRYYIDDPSGGVLDGAFDSRWAWRLRQAFTARPELGLSLIPKGRPGTAIPGLRSVLGRRDRAGALWVVGVWAVTRLMFLIVGLSIMRQTGESFASALSKWDVDHFLTIAREGYGTGGVVDTMAFFPGLPGVMAGSEAIGIPGPVGGMIITWIAALAAALALYRLGGFWAAALWLIAPTAIFLFVPYTEALFCALAFWAWERARSDRWWQAALLASGACLIRVSGLFLIAALVVMVLTWRLDDGVTLGQRALAWLRRGVWLVIPVGVLFAHAAYLYSLTGVWMAWYEAQTSGWQRAWTAPWDSIMTTIRVIASDQYDGRPGWDTVFTFELVSYAVGLLCVGFLLARRMWAEMTWILIQLIAFASSTWLFSINRAVLLWFPVWIVTAELITRRPKTDDRLAGQRLGLAVWVVISVLAALWWARMWFTGQWVS